jgi:hypothetical protein
VQWLARSFGLFLAAGPRWPLLSAQRSVAASARPSGAPSGLSFLIIGRACAERMRRPLQQNLQGANHAVCAFSGAGGKQRRHHVHLVALHPLAYDYRQRLEARIRVGGNHDLFRLAGRLGAVRH